MDNNIIVSLHIFLLLIYLIWSLSGCATLICKTIDVRCNLSSGATGTRMSTLSHIYSHRCYLAYTKSDQGSALKFESSGNLSLQSSQYNFTFLLTTAKTRVHILLPFTFPWPNLICPLFLSFIKRNGRAVYFLQSESITMVVNGKYGPELVTNIGAGDLTTLNDRTWEKGFAHLGDSPALCFTLLPARSPPFLCQLRHFSAPSKELVQPLTWQKTICIFEWSHFLLWQRTDVTWSCTSQSLQWAWGCGELPWQRAGAEQDPPPGSRELPEWVRRFLKPQ